MDPLSDMLQTIKNGLLVRKETVSFPHSRLKVEVLRVLQEKGYLAGTTVKGRRSGKVIEVTLGYEEDGAPRIRGVERISKLSRRVYAGAKRLPRGRPGLLIVSTPGGVMAAGSAAAKNLGGEIICRVW